MVIKKILTHMHSCTNTHTQSLSLSLTQSSQQARSLNINKNNFCIALFSGVHKLIALYNITVVQYRVLLIITDKFNSV